MERNWDKRQILKIDVKKICRNASNDRLMADDKYRVFLSLDPVDQWLKSADNVKIALSAWVSKLKFFFLSLLVKFRIFILNFFVCKGLTDSCIKLI